MIRRYYRAWAKRNREEVSALLAEDLDFRSVEDCFLRASEFLESCWKYSKGLVGVRFIKELYAGDQAFVVIVWENDDGSHFVGAEPPKVESGRICEILVVNSSSSFGELVKE